MALEKLFLTYLWFDGQMSDVTDVSWNNIKIPLLWYRRLLKNVLKSRWLLICGSDRWLSKNSRLRYRCLCKKLKKNPCLWLDDDASWKNILLNSKLVVNTRILKKSHLWYRWRWNNILIILRWRSHNINTNYSWKNPHVVMLIWFPHLQKCVFQFDHCTCCLKIIDPL